MIPQRTKPLHRFPGTGAFSSLVDIQRLSGLRCLLRKRASVNGYPIEWLVSFTRSQHLTNGCRAMQFRILAELCDTTTYILARQCCVNALISGPADHCAFRPAIFYSLLEIPIHFIFHLHTKYTASQHRTPAPVSRSGGSALCERVSLRSIY